MQTYKKRPGGGNAVPKSPAAQAVIEGNLNYQPTAADMGSRTDLPEAMRAKMETAFGMDFSGVQLYQSQAVADAGANAMTMGNKIAFAPGKLDFSSHSGQALLGHELSHVASQARGEVSGQGFLDNSLLEARADREGAMAAAGESVYSGPVTPLSATSTAMSAAGPMQAKKEKKKNQGEQFRDAHKEMSKSEEVKTFEDLAFGGEIKDQSLSDAFSGTVQSMGRDEDFASEYLKQRTEKSQALLDYYNGMKQRGMGDDEAWFRTQFSDQSLALKKNRDVMTMFGGLGFEGGRNETMYTTILDKIREQKKEVLDINDAAGQFDIKDSASGEKNKWEGENPREAKVLIDGFNKKYAEAKDIKTAPQSKARKKWLAKQAKKKKK